MKRRFSYFYKTSDGVRHEAEMVGTTREEVFSELRKRGIRPIRVVDQGAGKARILLWAAIAASTVGLCAGVAWVAVRTLPARPMEAGRKRQMFYAKPLVRQPIHGETERKREAIEKGFEHEAERVLARFAEPGTKVEKITLTAELERDFREVIKKPIFVSEEERSELVDLKRIVCGMKREMSAYLSGGGTVRGYLDELVKRQEKERKLRESVEREVLTRIRENKGEEDLSRAYDYFLKANASLQSMGIKPVDVPSELLGFQFMPLEAE